MAPKIVVLGGGFAGLNAALAAVRSSRGACEVTLVSRDPWLTVRPRLYESEPEQLRVELTEPLSAVGAEFVAGTAARIEARSLVLASGARVPFDRLVIATGSVMRHPDLRGAADAYSIDDLDGAIAFDRRLQALKGRSAIRIVIVGAGFTGIELALEMRDRIAAHAGITAGEEAEILLIDRGPVVGAGLGPGPRPAIEAALGEAGVELALSAQLKAVADDRLVFRGGRTIEADAVVLCTGLRAAPFVGQLPGEKDAAGRVICGPHLEVPAMPDVFVAGDAACAAPEPGRQTLMSCQHALVLGRYAGENAARAALGQPLVPYRQPRYVTCLALGRSGAVFCEGWDRTPKSEGAEAKAIKTRINTQAIYPPAGGREELLAWSRLPAN
jgi:NADH dehydrogenase